MLFGISILQKKSLLRVSGEERSTEILISFHSSGLTSNQWRKLKNPWFPGRTLFRPSYFKTGKKKHFFAQLAHSAGPTCILYLAEEASNKLEFLPSWDSMDHLFLHSVLGGFSTYSSFPNPWPKTFSIVSQSVAFSPPVTCFAEPPKGPGSLLAKLIWAKTTLALTSE